MTTRPDRRHRTLRLLGTAAADPLDPLDPACAHGPQAAQLVRLFSRQLFSYRPHPNLLDWLAVEPVPDLAAEIPSIYNAGVGASYLSHVVHLRPAVFWDTTPPRPVTTADVVRGLKRMANPVARSPLLGYFTSAIRGLAEFCAEYEAAVGADPTAAELAAFQNTHDIAGVLAVDEQTVIVELARPALDIADLLALPCASAAPVEYDQYLPGSPQLHRNLRSNGPFRLVSGAGGGPVRLESNPVWDAESDPLRRQHVDAIEIVAAARSPRQVASAVAAGEADLPWGPPRARHTDGPRRPAHDLGQELSPYLAFNLRSPVAGGALRRAEVRRALAMALDRAGIAALIEDLVPGDVVRPAWSLVPPGNDGHRAADPEPGGPDECRAALEAAGLPDGLRLTGVHPDTELDLRIAERYAADLDKAGVTVDLLGLPAADHRRLLERPDGRWDLTALSWFPGWTYQNWRAFLQPLVSSRPVGGTANYGGYHNPEVERLIDQALDTVDRPHADAVWRQVEQMVLAEAPVVPIAFRTTAGPPLAGPRVLSAVAMPALGHAVDLCTVELGVDAGPDVTAAGRSGPGPG